MNRFLNRALVFAGLSVLLVCGRLQAVVVGPAFPPLKGCGFSPSGANLGVAGGVTWSFYGVALAQFDAMFWGAVNNGVQMSYGNPSFTGYGETMGFQSLSGNQLIYAGQTAFGGTTFSTRCRVTIIGASLVLANPSGVPGNMGYVASITSPNATFTVNLVMETFYGGTWTPANTAFDNFCAASHISAGGQSYTSFSGGFWYTDSAPGISSFPDLTLAPGATSAAIPFTIGDVETPATNLQLAATYSGPVAGVDFTGTDTARSLKVRTLGTPGSSTVVVKVTDGDGVTSTSQFKVVVDNAPTISPLGDLVIQMNSTSAPINITVGDPDGNLGGLTLAPICANTNLVPISNFIFGGSGANRTLTLAGRTNQFGVVTVGAVVSDGFLSSTSLFTLTINSPPKVSANNGATVNQGGSVTLSPGNLSASDADNFPSQITFTVNPDGSGGPPHNGVLYKSGVALGTGSTFTLADLANNAISYVNGGSCDTSDDFQFGLTDSSGGIASDNGHTVFSFHFTINPVVVPPTAFDGVLNVPIGGSGSGVLNATNPDCRNTTLTYYLVVPPAKGMVTGLNPTTGNFTYTAGAGQLGYDFFAFGVSNAAAASVMNGVISINILNTRPTANATNFNGPQNVALTGKLTATDPDLPAQPLSFTIGTAPQKGTLSLTANTGAFTFTPFPGRFGFDSFTFTVSDGITNSAPATAQIYLRPTVAAFGQFLIADGDAPGVRLFDLSTGDLGLLASGAPLNSPSYLASEAAGTVVVTDQNAGLIRIDPATGGQTVIVDHATLPFALGVAVDADQNLLATAAGADQISKFTPAGNLITNLPLTGSGLTVPAGLAISPANGQIFVANAGFFGGGQNALFQIDPLTLQPTLAAYGALFTGPVGVAVEPSGNVLVAQIAPVGTVTRVVFPGGMATPLTTGSQLNQPFGIAVNSAGAIYVLNQGDGSITRVDPVTGAQTVAAPAKTGGNKAFGLAIAGMPIVPPVITGGQFTAPGVFQVTVRGYPGTPYTLLSSPQVDLPVAQWTVVGTFMESTPGNFTALDTTGGTGPTRFYRARFN